MEKILEMEKNVDLLRPDCWQDNEKNFDSSHCRRCDNEDVCQAWQALKSFVRKPFLVVLDGARRDVEDKNIKIINKKIHADDFLAAWIKENLC